MIEVYKISIVLVVDRRGLYKPCTGRCMKHAPAILAAPALVYSTHRLLVVWIIVAHFHLCSLLDRYTVLELRSWSSSTADVCLLWQPMGTVRAFH